MAITGRLFEARSVALDNRTFVDCTFKRCRLIYKGGKPPSFQQCDFWGNEFIFEGPAGNTLAFLQSLSAPESGLQTIFAQIFPQR